MKSNQLERAVILDRMLGENRGRISCKYCYMRLPDHLEDCALMKIDPVKVVGWHADAKNQFKKNLLKKAPPILRDQHTSSVRVPKGRKPGTRPNNHQDPEMVWCHECQARRISKRINGVWVCMRCNSE